MAAAKMKVNTNVNYQVRYSTRSSFVVRVIFLWVDFAVTVLSLHRYPVLVWTVSLGYNNLSQHAHRSERL